MYIEWYIQTVQQITWTLIHKNQFTSLCRGQKPASKCIRLVYEILVICRALQALYTSQRCELMKKNTHTQKNKQKQKKQQQQKNKKKNNITLTVPIEYSLFADHRSVPPFGPGFFCLNSWLTLPKQSLCTIFAIRGNWWYPLDITSIGIDGTPLVPGISLCPGILGYTSLGCPTVCVLARLY